MIWNILVETKKCINIYQQIQSRMTYTSSYLTILFASILAAFNLWLVSSSVIDDSGGGVIGSIVLVTETISSGTPCSFLPFTTDMTVVAPGPCLDLPWVMIAASVSVDMAGYYSARVGDRLNKLKIQNSKQSKSQRPFGAMGDVYTDIYYVSGSVFFPISVNPQTRFPHWLSV